MFINRVYRTFELTEDCHGFLYGKRNGSCSPSTFVNTLIDVFLGFPNEVQDLFMGYLMKLYQEAVLNRNTSFKNLLQVKLLHQTSTMFTTNSVSIMPALCFFMAFHMKSPVLDAFVFRRLTATLPEVFSPASLMRVCFLWGKSV